MSAGMWLGYKAMKFAIQEDPSPSGEYLNTYFHLDFISQPCCYFWSALLFLSRDVLCSCCLLNIFCLLSVDGFSVLHGAHASILITLLLLVTLMGVYCWLGTLFKCFSNDNSSQQAVTFISEKSLKWSALHNCFDTLVIAEIISIASVTLLDLTS